MLLFSGLGLFSYFLIANYTDFSPKTAEAFYSWGAVVFTILAFNLVGYSTLRLSEWVNRQYVINTFRKWKLVMVYMSVIFLFLMLNYGVFVKAKILANVEPIFNFSRSGWNLLIVVWMAEMVVIGLLLSNRTLQANWLLQQEAAKLQMENSRAKYTALQNQLNPHFLFNSLNTIGVTALVGDSKMVMQMVEATGKILRYSLYHQELMTNLDDELDVVLQYLFLHTVRYGLIWIFSHKIFISLTEDIEESLIL